MNNYLSWNTKTISDFSDTNINSLYNQGFLFTREGRGAMYQTRSLRIDLEKFELSSENRRILKKTENLQLKACSIPLADYDWSIGKMAKDFYETKFEKGVFSANKVKELLTVGHNFNLLLQYQTERGTRNEEHNVGYCICYNSKKLLHYSYPFYSLSSSPVPRPTNLGLGMMLRAIIYAKETGKKYVYLGSAKDAKAKYKLQFAGLEWFDSEKWRNDIEELKKILK